MIKDYLNVRDGAVFASAVVELELGIGVMSAIEMSRAVRGSGVKAFICRGSYREGKPLVDMSESGRVVAMEFCKGSVASVVVRGDDPRAMQLARRIYSGITTPGMYADLDRLG